jgi:hypothetical protein
METVFVVCDFTLRNFLFKGGGGRTKLDYIEEYLHFVYEVIHSIETPN